MDIGDVTRNTKLLVSNIPYNVEDVDFVKPGKGRAIYRLRLRNLLNNTVLDVTYHSADKVEETSVTSHEMQYLYQEGDSFIFMDTENFEQYQIPAARVGDKKYYLKEGIPVTILMWEGKPIDINLPITVELRVEKSAVTTRTDTVTAQPKAVITETGLTVGVPAFVKEGDILKIDTRTGQYLERVGTARG